MSGRTFRFRDFSFVLLLAGSIVSPLSLCAAGTTVPKGLSVLPSRFALHGLHDGRQLLSRRHQLR